MAGSIHWLSGNPLISLLLPLLLGNQIDFSSLKHCWKDPLSPCEVLTQFVLWQGRVKSCFPLELKVSVVHKSRTNTVHFVNKNTACKKTEGSATSLKSRRSSQKSFKILTSKLYSVFIRNFSILYVMWRKIKGSATPWNLVQPLWNLCWNLSWFWNLKICCKFRILSVYSP